MLGSLRSRLALSNLAISLCALIVLILVFGEILRQQTIDSNEKFVRQEASLVQSHVERAVRQAFGPKGIPIRKFFSVFRNDSRLFDKRIVFYPDQGGACVFSSQASSCQGVQDWRIQPTDKSAAVSGLVDRNGQSVYVVQMPAGHGSVVVLLTPGGAVIPGIDVLAPGVLLALVAAVVIWLAMTVFFGFSVSRPLAKVSAAARAIAAGDYSRTVDVSNRGEIGELGSSFNHMVTHVRLSNQLLKDFVANVSHDLRTPITVISGFAGSIVDGTTGTREETIEAGAIIAGEATRMEHLVDDLLQLTRLESGLRPFQPVPVSVPGLVQRSVRRALTAAPDRTIIRDIPEDLPLAWGDEELLERVLMNLLNNAVAYTPVGGEVTVSASADDHWISVKVTDRGVGIDADDQPRVFERFFRVDKSRGGGQTHSGLGLPIVKEIIEAHGGVVGVISTPGEGSTFRFTVPVAAAS